MAEHTSDLEKQVRTLRKRSIFTLFLTWLALFFTIIGIAAGYKNFLRVHDKAKQARDDAKVAVALMPQMASKASIETWQQQVRSQLVANQAQSADELTELRALKNSNVYIETTLKKQIEQLTRQQQLLNSQVSSVPKQLGDSWQIAEIRYLLKIAERHLRLNQDASTAIIALKAADQELIALASPSLLPIRALIARDIASLQGFQSVDLASVLSTIDDLAKQLSPLLTNERLEGKKPDAIEDMGRNTDSVLNRMKAKLDEAVVIKRYDNKLAQTIKGDTQLVRYELIRLKLETLKLLALKSQQKAYKGQLEQLAQLLKLEHTGLLDRSASATLSRLEGMALQSAPPKLLSAQLFDELLVDATKEQP